MELLATAEQMQSFDRTAIQTYEMPGLILMENAGRAFVDALELEYGPVHGRRVLVVCGKGNNGGDGLVIARHLANHGARVHALLLGQPGELKGDARTNYDIVRKMAGAAFDLTTVTGPAALQGMGAAEVIVDAIFGTGFSGEVTGLYRNAIEMINQNETFVASVDIASGVSATDGSVANMAVKAHLTVTMGLAKIGHYVGAGADHAGKVLVADISIPSSALQASGPAAYRVRAADVASLLPKRARTAHKYGVGKVFVLAGSRNFTGAPTMTAEAALVAGAGAVILGAPRSIHATLASRLTEAIIEPLDETAEGTVASSAEEAIRKRIEWADAVVMGPGLSRNEETDRLLASLVSSIEKPLILDADGLNAVAPDPTIIARRRAETILTPHVGELARLTKGQTSDIERRRVESARAAAAQFQSVVVLKGAPTATADPGGDVFVNSTGNPGMATIGAGDVLTGVVAALRAQGMTAIQSAWSGVYIHGMAGDFAATELGQRSVLAMDILDHVPAALLGIEK